MAEHSIIGRTATEMSGLVRSGGISAREITEQHLAHILSTSDAHGAFEHLAPDTAARDAARIDALAPAERNALPLAGVPVAIKDNVPVAGLPMRVGSRARRPGASPDDHIVVARLRAAGAVVIGTTRVPELCLWGTSDNAYGTARSPWAPDRTAGGSSGGSAAAVASGYVPIAHGNDGLGSIRIPAACCGLVGIKPGFGVVPSHLGPNSWYGLAENGALATTVADAALMLSVLCGDATFASVVPPDRRLRVAMAMRPPAPGIRAHPEVVRHTREVAVALQSLGHVVEEVAPPMPTLTEALATLGTWCAGAHDEVDAVLAEDVGARPRLERRTRVHAAFGPAARRLGLVDERHRARWRATMDAFLSRYDVMLTPTLAGPPLRAGPWRSKGWLSNLIANVRAAPYCGPINFARLPAVAIPAGVHEDGTPASVHFVGPAGSERLLVGLAGELEGARPWTRFSPRISHAFPVTQGTRSRAEQS